MPWLLQVCCKSLVCDLACVPRGKAFCACPGPLAFLPALLIEAHGLLPGSLHLVNGGGLRFPVKYPTPGHWACGVCSQCPHTSQSVLTHPKLWVWVWGACGERTVCFCTSLTRHSFCVGVPVSPSKESIPGDSNPVHCFLVPPLSFSQLKGPDKQGNLRILMT